MKLWQTGGIMTKIVAPYGSWKSSITTDFVSAKNISVEAPCIDGEDIYWIESRPLEEGRSVIMQRTPDGNTYECTPPGFNVRTRVHEYGGGAYTVFKGVIYFCNFEDQHLYSQQTGMVPELLTPQEGYRYADLVVDPWRNRIICIREDHTGEGEAVNTIVGISLGGNDNGQVLVEGNNFYSSARLSPDGTQLAWLTWNHPNMPWDGCELWLADVSADGTFQAPRLIAGSESESIFQPEWSPEGVLHFVAEYSGWWNLYRWQDGAVEALWPVEAEFAYPQWMFGITTYGFLSGHLIACSYFHNGIWQLALLDTVEKKPTLVDTPFSVMVWLLCGKDFITFLSGAPTSPVALVRFEPFTGRLETLRQEFEFSLAVDELSLPKSIFFPTTGDQLAHAFYYPPHNPVYEAPAGTLPPLLVISHGGPTGAAFTFLNFRIQYWTSRGFAVVDVNYGGSCGFGREYRQRLNGKWGIVDLDDCCNAALYLVEQGLADPNRLAIRGGSAGGYTTLACLAFRKVFHAGASHYGLSDLEFFTKDTHKFESHYLHSLVGPYPECQNIYYERSPIHFVQNFSCPIILFQGDEDKIVPPNQAKLMFEALRAKGIPAAYVLFQGEQHGFLKAESIKRSFEGELYFYSKIFKFDLAEKIEPVQIENL
jgi:dipeptidyl aminopeptidase/acylaminoacyl peptidase